MCSEDMDERDVEVKGTGRVEPSALQMDGVSKSPSQGLDIQRSTSPLPVYIQKKTTYMGGREGT